MTFVSIIGDFDSSIFPLFYQFRKDIKKHIVVYDDFKCDLKEAKRVIKGFKNFSIKKNLNIKTVIYCVDEDSYQAINKLIDFIEKNCKNRSKLLINSTDGLSNINILLSQAFLPQGVKIASYDRYDNHCNVITKNSMETYKIDQNIPIKDHFLLKGIQIEKTSSKKLAKKHQHQIIEIFESHQEEFKEYANFVQINKNPSINNKKYKNINKLIKQLGIKDIKSNQMFITGGLFEYYIYLKLKSLDFDDIELGVQVKQYIDKTNFIPNEFDILIMKENHLHMIECKYTKRIKRDQLVYKYMALKNIIDDDGKIIMVTAHDDFNPLINNENPLEFLPHKRAKENKMILLGDPLKDIDQFVKIVKGYFEI